MKKQFLMLFWAAISLNTANGQKINIQMKGGFLSSKMDYSWETPVKNEGYSRDFRPTFALSVDGQLYKGLYVGAEIGTCSYLYAMNFSYKQSYNNPYTTTTTYTGSYKQEQIYFTINPQYKFGYEGVFGIGGGVGIYNNTVNTFSNGRASTQSNNPQSIGSSYKLDGQDYHEPNATIGGFVNAIINPKTKNIGLILEARYIFNGYPKTFTPTGDKPDIRFNSFAFMGGLSFHF